MVRSRLPVPSLLGLFAALLMLPPELLMDKTGSFSDVPVDDPRVQKGLADAVKAYNRNRADGANYFKILRVLNTKLKVEDGKVLEYHLKVQMVETSCPKKTKEVMKTYKQIQQCKPLPGNPQKLKVYFKLFSSPRPN